MGLNIMKIHFHTQIEGCRKNNVPIVNIYKTPVAAHMAQ
jgi:hypothetical protein